MTGMERQELKIKKSQLDAVTAACVGIDVGSEFTKLVFVSELDPSHYNLNCVLLPNMEIHTALRIVVDECKMLRLDDARGQLKVTGVAYNYESDYRQLLNCRSEFVVETLCWIRGCYWSVQHLDPESIFHPTEPADACFSKVNSSSVLTNIQANLGIPDDSRNFPAVLVNAGTSISMSIVNESGQAERMSMCFFNCKSLLGLSAILVGTADYEELMAMAEQGNRSEVDLNIGELQDKDPLNPFVSCCHADMPLMHLAKIANNPQLAARASKADIARSIVSLFCFNLFGNVLSFATAGRITSVFLGGNFFKSRLVRKEFENAKSFLLKNHGFKHRFLKIGGHIGCIGALISDNDMAPEILKFSS